MTRKNSGSPIKMNKKTAVIIAIAMVIALCAYLLFQIYIAKELTWNDIYEGLEVETSAAVDGEVSVNILDVGQGSCTVIIAGGDVVMIDAGERSASDEIIAFLDRNEIAEIDYLIASHPHSDHIGGMQKVVEHCEIGETIFSNHAEELTPTINIYINLLDTLLERDIPTRAAATGERINLERGTLTVLSDGSGYSDLNDCSIVIRYDYGLASFLIMGDAETPVENNLLADGADVAADVLVAGHHGSRTSTGENFLNAVNPAYVAVSCGIDNSYGHPHREVVDRISRQGSQLIRTDLAGDIIFICDGGEPSYSNAA